MGSSFGYHVILDNTPSCATHSFMDLEKHPHPKKKMNANASQTSKCLKQKLETNTAPVNGWLEDLFPFEKANFQGLYVNIGKGNSYIYDCPSSDTSDTTPWDFQCFSWPTAMSASHPKKSIRRVGATGGHKKGQGMCSTPLSPHSKIRCFFVADPRPVNTKNALCFMVEKEHVYLHNKM